MDTLLYPEPVSGFFPDLDKYIIVTGQSVIHTGLTLTQFSSSQDD